MSSVDFELGANLENLTLTGALHTEGTGNELANVITGNAGDNILDGAGGNDTLTGGKGNDLYVVNSVADKVVEAAGGGHDTVQSSVTFSLSTLRTSKTCCWAATTTSMAPAMRSPTRSTATTAPTSWMAPAATTISRATSATTP